MPPSKSSSSATARGWVSEAGHDASHSVFTTLRSHKSREKMKKMFISLGPDGLKLELLDVDCAGRPIVVNDDDDAVSVPPDNSAE